MKNKVLRLASMMMVMGPMMAIAAPISYDTHVDLGGTGQVNGIIVTDGTIGTIGAVNIMSWAFTVSDGTDTFVFESTFAGALINQQGASELIADATELTYDYTTGALPATSFAFEANLLSGGVGRLTFFQGGVEIIHDISQVISHTQLEQFNTPEVIGFLTDPEPGNGGPPPPVTEVPEPTTLALLGLGLAGMGFSRRKKKV